MFTLTESAAREILRAAHSQSESVDPPMLRVAAKFGDSGEVVYGMGFDEERENDAIIDSAGIRILIAPRSQELLADTTLDFVELNPGEFQFIFSNPQQCEDTGTKAGCSGCRGGQCNT